MKSILLTLSLILINVIYCMSVDITAELINNIKLDSLISTVEDLSGERRVTINGMDTIIRKRKFNSFGNILAGEYLYEKGKLYNYKVYYQNCLDDCRNVIWEREGSEKPEKVIIMGAHYDSENFDEYNGETPFLSPGANDNASGVAALVEIARILNDYEPIYTIKFIFWDNEEIGLLGSQFYVNEAQILNEDIMVYMNLDMIGWDENDDGEFELKYLNKADSKYYAESIVDLCKKYKLKLSPIVMQGEKGDIYYCGDAGWFWHLGYSAVCISDFMDYFSCYHSQNDLIEFFNRNYFLENTKLSLAFLYKFGYENNNSDVQQHYFNSDFLLIYPNPASEYIEISFDRWTPSGRWSPSVIKIYNSFGECVLTESIHPLTPSHRINVSSLPVGTYFLILGSFYDKFVVIK